MTSGETQHFESKSFHQRESDAIQGMDSDSSTDWASAYFEYHASGSGEHKEMKRESETSVRQLLCFLGYR